MQILVIGGGGREHALAWKLAHSPKVTQVFVAPGNGGTACAPQMQNLPITDIHALREWVQNNSIDFTVVGPEAPLAAGVVDEFRSHGLRIFGPTQAAAQLESSKAFAKAFMKRYNIPTAQYATFVASEIEQAHRYVEEQGAPIVIKADGLAAGKGVVVALTLPEAHQAVDLMLQNNEQSTGNENKLNHANDQARIVIEEFLQGEEASFIVMCDGKTALALATSQDHKRLLDGDLGPNTGGMGAYSPAPVITADVHARVMREIIYPTLKGMEKEGRPYTGFLYAGLMIDAQGQPKTLEFNCRMGDPETQPILMRLKSDLSDVLSAAIDAKLEQIELQWDRRTALGVVLAAAGYPNEPRIGDALHDVSTNPHELSQNSDVLIFHAGTTLKDGVLLSNGGRVLCVTALGETVKAAQSRAYETLHQIHLKGAQYRRDIGSKAIKNTSALNAN